MQKGYSIVAILVTVALSSLVFGVANQFFSSNMKMSRNFSHENDLRMIRDMVKNLTSCTDTIPLGTCTDDQILEIRRLGPDSGTPGDVLISDDGGDPTKFGKWTVRAECQNNSIVFRAALLATSGSLNSTAPEDFKANMQGNVFTWNETETLLFPQGVAMCGGHLTGFVCQTVDNQALTEDVTVTCPVGYSVMGCSTACSGRSQDTRVYMDSATNSCTTKDRQCPNERHVSARCCRDQI